MVCFHLVTLGKNILTKSEINSVLKTVVNQNSYAYQTLLNTLSPIQQRTLRLAAKEEKQVFAKDLLEKYEIPSGAALASAIKALKVKEILDEVAEKGEVIFDDPLFAMWLRNNL